MADFSIALSGIRNTRTVNIEGLGVITARRLGSGEELELSAKSRRLGKIFDELGRMDFTKFDTSKPEELKELKKLTDKAEKLYLEVEEIKRFEMSIYRGLLSDDKGGKVVDVIMNTLTDEERGELFKQIFGKSTQVVAPDVETAEGKSDE
jgi:vacuolar-type H+-ATPase subunit I/STV1